MKINRNNYEKWFIDYLDGTLDENSEKAVQAFLKDNPDLAEELESVGNIRLAPENVPFPGKASLFMENAEDLCPGRADYLLIKQMEEGLNEEEEKELAEMIDSDASLLKRGDLYQHSRLKAPSLTFESKENLLRKRVSGVFSKNLYRWASVAAVGLMLLYFGWHLLEVSPESRGNWSASRLESRGFTGFEIPEVSVVLNDMPRQHNQLENSEALSPQNSSFFSDDRENSFSGIESKSRLMISEMTPLRPKLISAELLHVEQPNGYETGLRYMMPLYLELNRNREKFLAGKENDGASVDNKSVIFRGMQLMDKLGGDLVHFDKIYDEEGNYVAFNFKTGAFEVEKRIKH